MTLQHVGERWYQPGIGRFIQRDPIGLAGGMNVYAYALNQPIRLVDPNGQWSTFEAVKWGVVGAAATAIGIIAAPVTVPTAVVVGAAGVAGGLTGLAGGLEEEDLPMFPQACVEIYEAGLGLLPDPHAHDDDPDWEDPYPMNPGGERPVSPGGRMNY